MNPFIQRIEQYITQHDITLVSLDLFDTLLFRQVALPGQIAEHAYRMLQDTLQLPLSAEEFAELRRVAEQKAKLARLDREVLLADIYAQMPLRDDHKAMLQTAELAAETSYGTLNPELLAWLLARLAEGKQVIFISDMYLTAEQIRTSFFHDYPVLCEVPLYVSGELKCSKLHGGMFTHVLAERQVSTGHWLHIGDHPMADNRMPASMGIQTLAACAGLDLPLIYRAEVLLENQPCQLNSLRTQACIFDRPAETSNAFDIGAAVFGPVLLAFCDWVLAQAIKSQARKIVCLMRDAEVFAPLLTLRQQQRGLNRCEVIKCFVSRKSSYWPSIDTDASDWLDKVLSRLQRRRGLTLGDIYRQFSLPDDALVAEYGQHNLLVADSVFVGQKTLLARIRETMQAHQDKTRAYICAQRGLLHDYFAQTVKAPLAECVVLDFGNGASIHHQLEQAFGQNAAANLMLFSSVRAYEHLPHTLSAAYFGAHNSPSGLRDKLRRSPECVEALLLGHGGSTQHYRRNAQRVEPLLGQVVDNQLHVDSFLAGCLAFMQRAGAEATVSAEEASAILNRYLQRPTRQEAELFRQVLHEDNFGANQAFPVISEQQIQWMRERGVAQAMTDFAKQPNYQFGFIHWPQAVASLLDEGFHFQLAGSVKSDTAEKAMQLADKLRELGWASFCVYGAGAFFQHLRVYLQPYGLAVSCLVDKKADVQGEHQYEGYRVMNLRGALLRGERRFAIASFAFRDEIANLIFSLCQQMQIADVEVVSV